MNALQLPTRTPARQTFVPANPSGRVGLFLAGRRFPTSGTSATPRPTPGWTSAPACRGPAAWPSR